MLVAETPDPREVEHGELSTQTRVNFLYPLGQYCLWHDDECLAFGVRLEGVMYLCDGRRGLAETHFVGENPTTRDTVNRTALATLHPLNGLSLMGKEGAAEWIHSGVGLG